MATEQLISAVDIDERFVPLPRDALIVRELGDEVLVIDADTGISHVLNTTGALVWSLFDGEASLSDLTQELSEAFGVPQAQIGGDVVGLTRSLGGLGLLEGVVADRPEHSDQGPAMPSGVEVGGELPPFRLPALDGGFVDLSDLRGRGVLLVNWSPTCGYCAKIAPDLAGVSGPLAEAGIDILLLASGDPDQNKEMLREHGVTAPVALRGGVDGADGVDGFEDPFPGMGTPVAYLIDEHGRVADELAYGALEVPQLARRAAGLPEPEPEEPEPVTEDGSAAPRFLPVAASGVCGPTATKKPLRIWAATGSYRLGDVLLGIRADSEETDHLLGRIFASVRDDGAGEAPPNFSVVMPSTSKSSTKGLNLLLYGDTTIVRSRSPRRVVMGLAQYLSSLLESPESDLLRVQAVAAVRDNHAVLLPIEMGATRERLQPRLARLGFSLIDAPHVFVDGAAGQLVVPEPNVMMDVDAIATLPEPRPGRSEGAPVGPGRFALDTWFVRADDGTGQFDSCEVRLGRAASVAATLHLVLEPYDIHRRLDRVCDLFERIDAIPVPGDDGEQLAAALERA